MNKILVITGPTATGKTDLGLELSKEFNGEILSADSRQIYKHMDIGTGKDIQHFQWGIDLVNPDEPFSVSQYVDYAQKVLADIRQREKLPIVVGGTGLYIKELLEPSQTLHLKPNEKLRQQLAGFSLEELQNEIQKKDLKKWESLNGSDRQNPRRLIRAIEVAGLPLNQQRPNYEALIIGLTAPYSFLYERIDKRVDERIKMGAQKEKEKLHQQGFFPNAFGYKDQTPQEWKYGEHAYARRQMSYLKSKLPGVRWFDISQEGFKEKIVQTVSKWYSDDDGHG